MPVTYGIGSGNSISGAAKTIKNPKTQSIETIVWAAIVFISFSPFGLWSAVQVDAKPSPKVIVYSLASAVLSVCRPTLCVRPLS